MDNIDLGGLDLGNLDTCIINMDAMKSKRENMAYNFNVVIPILTGCLKLYFVQGSDSLYYGLGYDNCYFSQGSDNHYLCHREKFFIIKLNT